MIPDLHWAANVLIAENLFLKHEVHLVACSITLAIQKLEFLIERELATTSTLHLCFYSQTMQARKRTVGLSKESFFNIFTLQVN